LLKRVCQPIRPLEWSRETEHQRRRVFGLWAMLIAYYRFIMVLFQSLLSLIIQNQEPTTKKGVEAAMGVILIPLSVIGLTLLGLTFLFSVLSFALVEYIKPLRFLRGNKASWLVFTLSAVAAAALTLEIWLYFHLPLV
jgi:hypothetical protein